MIFCITLNYKFPIDIIKAHLENHKVWLMENIKLGNFIFAGPIENEEAGFILGNFINKEQLNLVLRDDPFVEFDLVDINIKGLSTILKNEKFVF